MDYSMTEIVAIQNLSLIILKHWANAGPMQNEMLGQCRNAGLDVLDQYWPNVGPTHGCPQGQY